MRISHGSEIREGPSYKPLGATHCKKFWISPYPDKMMILGIALLVIGLITTIFEHANLLESRSNAIPFGGISLMGSGIAPILYSIYRQKRTLEGILKSSENRQSRLLYLSLTTASRDFTIAHLLWRFVDLNKPFVFKQKTTSVVNRIIENGDREALNYVHYKKFVFTKSHLSHAINESNYFALELLFSYGIKINSDELTTLIDQAKRVSQARDAKPMQQVYSLDVDKEREKVMRTNRLCINSQSIFRFLLDRQKLIARDS